VAELPLHTNQALCFVEVTGKVRYSNHSALYRCLRFALQALVAGDLLLEAVAAAAVEAVVIQFAAAAADEAVDESCSDFAAQGHRLS